MPRMTRAAARTAIHEDEPEVEAEASQVPLPQTPQRSREQPQRSPQRAPLGEITINPPQEEEPKIMLEVNLTKPAKKGKGKKGKGGKKPKKAENKENEGEFDHDDDKENTPEVVEDDIPSRPSSAAEEACADLLKETKQALDNIKLDIRPSTPPSRAVRAARKQLTPKAHTPRFNPDVHKSPEVTSESPEKEDSFVNKIESRSPTKANSDPFVDEAPNGGTPIMSPSKLSPIKSPRPEDSIEAMDATEEALEILGQSLPNMEDDPFSPVESTKDDTMPESKPEPEVKRKTAKKPTATKPTKTATPKPSKEAITRTGSIRQSTIKSTAKAASPRPVTKPIAPRLATARTAPANAGTAVAVKPAPDSRPTIAKRSTSSTVSSSKAPTKPIAMPIRHKPRVSSITKTPFVPVKSTKAPTVSAFTLPGDAIAARLKKQREKRAEEAAAAPPPAPSAGPVKAATLGRINTRPSLASAKVGPGGTVRLPKAPRATILPDRSKRIVSNTSTDSMAVNVGGDSISAAKRSSTLGRMNTSAPRARASVISSPILRESRKTPSSLSPATTTAPTITAPTTAATTPTIASAPSLATSTTTAAKRASLVRSRTMPASSSSSRTSHAKNSSVSGREVFERGQKVLEAQALSRKEKEDAARRARAEAAERGRQASREWAEKMRAKQAATKAAKAKDGVVPMVEGVKEGVEAAG